MMLVVQMVSFAIGVVSFWFAMRSLANANRALRRIEQMRLGRDSLPTMDLGDALLDAFSPAESPYRKLAPAPSVCEACAARDKLLEPLPPQRSCPRCESGFELKVTMRCLDECDADTDSVARLPHLHARCPVCRAEWAELLPEHYAATKASAR